MNPPPVTTTDAAVLSIATVSKTFPGQRALDGVSVEVTGGEIHALLGENGSGKSTLIKILAGFHRPDPGGTILVDRTPLIEGSGPASHAAGLRFVHQDLALIPSLSVVDNLALGVGYGTRSLSWIPQKEVAATASELLGTMGFDFDVHRLVGELSAAERTSVAVARCLGGDAAATRFVVLDEPTASLPAVEVDQLFALLDSLRKRGVGVLYVTHRLREVFRIADRATVLRDGRLAATESIGDLDEDKLVELIIGKPAKAAVLAHTSTRTDAPALQVAGLQGDGVYDVSFNVYRGEVLGIAGLTGSGRETLCRLIFGAVPRTSGEVVVDGHEVGSASPSESVNVGMGFLPSDRKGESGIESLSTAANLTLARLGPVAHRGMLIAARESAEAKDWFARLDVRPRSPQRGLGELSGGNQQKVLIAKWLRLKPKALLLEEPTQGVDIQAKAEIHEHIDHAARDGAAIVVASSEAEELARLCDRVIVLHDGYVVEELLGPIDPQAITLATLGTARDRRRAS